MYLSKPVVVSRGSSPPVRTRPAGMGVEFENLDHDAHARIDELVRGLKGR